MDTFADPHGNIDSYQHPYEHRYIHSYGYVYSVTNPYGNSHFYCHFHPYCYADPNRITHRYGYMDTLFNTD